MAVYWSVILEEYQYEEIDFENDSEQVDDTHVKQQHLVSMDLYVSMIQIFFLLLSCNTFLFLFIFDSALRCKKGNVFIWYIIMSV